MEPQKCNPPAGMIDLKNNPIDFSEGCAQFWYTHTHILSYYHGSRFRRCPYTHTVALFFGMKDSYKYIYIYRACMQKVP